MSEYGGNGGRCRVHDLLGPVQQGTVLAEDAGQQACLDACLERAPFVVVRRAAFSDGYVAVGVRGALRSERFAALLARKHVDRVMRPEHLRLGARQSALPALRALAVVEQRWEGFALPWGPAGSVGFALASGAASVRPGSDLDLIVRAETLPSRTEAATWMRAMRGLPCRVDVQVELPGGGAALAEIVAPNDRILLRTPAGPQLLSRRAADCIETLAPERSA